ncbi:MAG: AAA family ATPase [Rothia mucilaginosa]|uniref:AAA family ATPase n=1 Tax=Rothia mucilaginosa TaxID=43675 RepID=A0A930KVS3_9MICC|nr:AAA family ATPase [Rothia mucilaginosa]MBF1657878.1 AAA family ATPase [Rothia mucilaginosa]
MSNKNNKPFACIKYIEDYTCKSFINFSNANIPFTVINYIYGNNGAGKSTLALGIEAEGNKLGKGAALFNAEYTNKNLLLDESNPNLIAGVVAAFGSENIEIKSKIRQYESDILGIENDISQKKDSIEGKVLNISNTIDAIFKRNKQGTNIRKKSIRIDNYEDEFEWIQGIKKTYEKDLIASKVSEDASEETDARSITCGAEEAQVRISDLESLRVPPKPKEFLEFKNLKDIIEKEYNVIEKVPDSLIRWIEDGLKIHQEGEICKFCTSSDLNLSKISQKLRMFKEQEWIQTQALLVASKENFHNLLQECNSFYTKLLGLALKSGFSLTIENELNVEELSRNFDGLIDKKLRNPEDFLDSEGLSDIRSAYIKGYEEICSQRDSLEENINDEKDRYRDYVNKVNDYAKNAVAKDVLDALNEGDLKDDVKYIGDMVNEIKKCRDEISSINIEKENLQNSISRYGKFVEYLNGELESIGMPFRLLEEKVDSGEYVIKNLQGDNISIQDISEGEKHILSLMYFYYKLFDDENLEHIKGDIALIIVDDPVSSLDEGNKLYILNVIMRLIDKVIANRNSSTSDDRQIFVMSHSRDDFNNIVYHRNKSVSELFEIYKNVDATGRMCSNIRLMNDRDTMGSYARLFKEVYEISKLKGSEDLSDCQVNHSLNSMRRVFEEYLSFKSKNILLPQVSNFGQIKEIYEISRSVDGVRKTISSRYEPRLRTFLSDINVGSHRITNVDGKYKIVEYAKTLMKYIEDTDKVHYDAMKQ